MKNLLILVFPIFLLSACGEKKAVLHDLYHETSFEYEGLETPALVIEEGIKSIVLCDKDNPDNPFNYNQKEISLKGTWTRRTKEKIYQQFDFYVLLKKTINLEGQRKVKFIMLDSTKTKVPNNLLQTNYDFSEERDGYTGFLTVSIGQPIDLDPAQSPILMTHISCDLHQGEGLIRKSNADAQIHYLTCHQADK